MSDIHITMDKLSGLASLFSPDGMTGPRSLSPEATSGICLIIEECTRDLDRICQQTEKALEVIERPGLKSSW